MEKISIEIANKQEELNQLIEFKRANMTSQIEEFKTAIENRVNESNNELEARINELKYYVNKYQKSRNEQLHNLRKHHLKVILRNPSYMIPNHEEELKKLKEFLNKIK